MRIKIKIFVVLAVLSFSLSGCNNNEEKNPNDGKVSPKDVTNPKSASGDGDMSQLPEFNFPVKEYNFGTVIQGEKVSYTFTFTNTGGSELIINNVKASCGCTTPRWTKKPIPPGSEGEVEVIFDSHGRQGEQKKSIKVFANTQPKTTQLRISCNIVTQ